MDSDSKKIDAGTISFTLQHRTLDGGIRHHADQGVSIQVMGNVGGKETELLRFDCFDNSPHYHYGPEKKNELQVMDPTVTGNPIGWTISQLKFNLPEMLKRAGYDDLVDQIDASLVSQKVDELESAAREMAFRERNTVTHNRGTNVIEAGNIRFGLEMRAVGQDGGMAIHVLGDVAGQEIELLAFDCFRMAPHYHYGPRNKNERIYWDKTVVPDTLAWTLDQFKKRKLSSMIARAGYPGIVAELDEEMIQAKLPEVESTALAMAKEAS